MSERERLYQLLDTVPDTQISYIIGYIQGITTIVNETPNDYTVEALNEVDKMKSSGTGQHFSGSTADFLDILEE